MKEVKLEKLSDLELFALIKAKLDAKQYVFVSHAKQRLEERGIIDLDVIHILNGERGYKRRRNKKKDKYELRHDNWNYCIEGCNLDNEEIRVIISFKQRWLVVITVIKL